MASAGADAIRPRPAKDMVSSAVAVALCSSPGRRQPHGEALEPVAGGAGQDIAQGAAIGAQDAGADHPRRPQQQRDAAADAQKDLVSGHVRRRPPGGRSSCAGGANCQTPVINAAFGVGASGMRGDVVVLRRSRRAEGSAPPPELSTLAAEHGRNPASSEGANRPRQGGSGQGRCNPAGAGLDDPRRLPLPLPTPKGGPTRRPVAAIAHP